MEADQPRIAPANPDPGTVSARTRAATGLREGREVLDFALAAQIRIVDRNSKERIVRNLAGNLPIPSAARAVRKGVRRRADRDRTGAIRNLVNVVRRIVTKVPNDRKTTDQSFVSPQPSRAGQASRACPAAFFSRTLPEDRT